MLGQIAGKYLPTILANPGTTGAITGGLMGAGGSILGNLTDNEVGEGPLRILSEAAGAAVGPALLGGIAGTALAGRHAAGKGIKRTPSASKDTVRTTGPKTRRNVDWDNAQLPKDKIPKGKERAYTQATDTRGRQIAKEANLLAAQQGANIDLGLAAVGIPLTAGIGGLIGGGVANVPGAIGIPGFGSGIDPESYGSSNLQQVRPNALYQMGGNLSR